MVKDVTPTSFNDEQQSMQALRQYGGYIVMAIALALASYFGWNYWQNHGGRIDNAAANDFAKLQADQTSIATLAENPANANSQQLTAANATFNSDLDSFINKHGDSVYTWQALMLKANQQMHANDAKSAVATLQKATTLKFGDAGLEAIATLRYAQALLANNQADEAQKVLQTTLPPAFDASKAEIMGDIALAKNDKATAITQYQKAWQIIEMRNEQNKTQQDRAMLRLKMQDLGLNPKLPTSNAVIAQPTLDQLASQPVQPSAQVESTATQADQNSSTASQPNVDVGVAQKESSAVSQETSSAASTTKAN